MVGDTGKARVREIVRDRMRTASPPLTIDALAKRADLATNTVSAFLGGKSWPQPAKLAALEAALSLPPGSLERVARGDNDVMVGSSDETGNAGHPHGDDLVVGLTPGALRNRSAAERDRIIAAAKLAALRELDEIDRARGRHDQD